MTGPSPDVVVVGGGVIGCAIAYALVAEGATVDVIERSHVGAESSSAAAGILAPRVHATEPEVFELAMASHRRFPSLVDAVRSDTSLDPEYVRSGVLDLAYEETREAELKPKIDWLRRAGHSVRWLDAPEALQLEPALHPNIRGGFYDEDAYHINPIRFTQALGQAAARRGARFHLGTDVLGLRRDGARATHVQTTGGDQVAGHVVLATGAWAGVYAEWVRAPIPVFPAKGQILTVYAAPPPLRSVVFGLDAYLLPRVDGTVVCGATVERVGFDKSLTVDGMAWLLEMVKALCPTLERAPIDRVWTGLRPGSPDDMPIVGLAPGWENVILATGHFRNGIMLAPVTADLVAGLIMREESSPLLGPLSPSRFAGFIEPTERDG
jgi:glycine oxidase